ncbi:MAG: VWA domain-containing protein [Ornithinimicrobium sp.]|uniref:VWA domain-containing protein n=1 Tax=Ornithinimicrobium sp. TaxID=1977084 RepID=UPI003D9AC5E3
MLKDVPSLLVLMLLVTAVAAQQEPQRPPTFRSGTQVVEIDVRVFDRDGRFVTGLTRDDFEVIEDDAPQQLQTFFFVDDPGGVGSAVKPGADLVRPPSEGPRPRQTWIFFFDLNHLTAGAGYDRSHKAVEDFIRDRFRDGDVGGILAGDKMINNRLTSVREELLNAVAQVKPLGDARNRMIELTREWPRLLNEEEALLVARGEREPLQRAAQRACSDEPEQCLVAEQMVRKKGQRMAGGIQRASLQSLSALNGLAGGLARMPGPKTVVFLSDGFAAQEIGTTLRSIVGQVGRAGARVYAIDVRGLNRGNAGMADQFQVEDSAGPATKFDSVADAPNSLAIDTGGLMIRNENNIGRALETIAADANRYYVIGFQPSNTTWDGKFRAVQVRVKRDGLRVRARKGYLALEPSRMTLPQQVKTPDANTADSVPTPPLGPPAPPEWPTPVLGLPDTIKPATPVTGTRTTVDDTEPAGAALRMRPDAHERVRELSGGETATASKLAAEGWAAYQRGDIEAAVGPLTKAAAQPGVRPWILYTLGLAQGGLGRPREAIASWERVRQAAPAFEPVYIDLAAKHASLSDLTSALGVLRDAEQRWPNDPEVHNAIGVIHFRRGALDEAIAAFSRATAAAPEDSLAHLNLGRAYELRFTRSRRYVTSQRRWVVDESDRLKGIKHYQACIRIGGPYVNAASDGLQRLEWSR